MSNLLWIIAIDSDQRRALDSHNCADRGCQPWDLTHLYRYLYNYYLYINFNPPHTQGLICEFAMGTIFKVFLKDFDNVNMHNMLE